MPTPNLTIPLTLVAVGAAPSVNAGLGPALLYLVGLIVLGIVALITFNPKPPPDPVTENNRLREEQKADLFTKTLIENTRRK